MTTLLAIVLIGYLPGALLYRTPFGRRDVRLAWPVEERFFWAVTLSVLVTSVAGLGLAVGGYYRFDRLLWVLGAVSAAAGVVAAARPHKPGGARRPGWSVALPLALVVLAWWVNFRVPPAEYVIGGRDQGTYMNSGIRLAQSGGVATADDLVRSVPLPFRPLFFRSAGADAGNTFVRFMGFFILDLDAGTVVGQFPPGYPLWLAVGYGLNGLNGARAVAPLFGLFGVLAVYFVGARLFGRAAALGAGALLAINVAQVWYSRDPNAEIVMQPVVFAGLLAYIRGVTDEEPFFAPVSALLLTLGGFVHITGVLAAAAVAAAALLDVLAFRRRVSPWFFVSLGAGIAACLAYLWKFIPPYFQAPYLFLVEQNWLMVGAGGAVIWLVLLGLRRLAPGPRRLTIGSLLTAGVWALGVYAYFFRFPIGPLAEQDAGSLRMLAAYYVSPFIIAAAAIGYAAAARRIDVTAPFLAVATAFGLFFLYKIRIIPEHFWAARRFVAVIIPGVLLLATAVLGADLAPEADAPRRPTWLLWMQGVAVALLVVPTAIGYARGASPILHHVEYAGVIPRLEQLAADLGDDDLLTVEPRSGSDVHVLGIPLAYIYARNVLVFTGDQPPKDVTRTFLSWALTRFKRVYFLGSAGGGIDLLWRSLRIGEVHAERFQVPEYEPAVRSYPRDVKHKEFDLIRYEFLRDPVTDPTFALDLGGADDAYVMGFHAKEKSASGFTFRWAQGLSRVAAVGVRAEHRTVTLWMGDGGRPATVEPASVSVSLDGHSLGTAIVRGGIQAYDFALPEDVAMAAGRNDAAAQLQIATSTWVPARIVGGTDTRDLGVMLDRVEVH